MPGYQGLFLIYYYEDWGMKPKNRERNERYSPHACVRSVCNGTYHFRITDTRSAESTCVLLGPCNTTCNEGSASYMGKEHLIQCARRVILGEAATMA